MNLLSNITKYAIDKKYITYNSLYDYNEEDVFNVLDNTIDYYLKSNLYIFRNIKKDDIPDMEFPKTKIKSLNPLINNKRLN